MKVHLTLKSANVKTGPIPVSTSSRSTCPASCSLRKNGCYADSGPLALHWDKVTSGERGTNWTSFCESIAALPNGQLWRHNQAGDLPCVGAEIDINALDMLLNANHGRNGFTYTHHDMTLQNNRDSVLMANLMGFTVNLSAETLTGADHLASLGIGPVVTLLDDSTDDRVTYTPQGRKVVTCPATYRDDVSCATCQLCAKQRDVIVGFPVHGTSKAKARKVFMMVSA